MNLDLTYAPELAQLAVPASTPFEGPGTVSGGMTAGRLAGLVRSAAADPARWRHQVRFDPQRPVRRRIAEEPGWELWLVTTPPGDRCAAADHGDRCEVLMVVLGELAVRTITAAGAADQPLRRGRVRVRGRAHLHEIVNPGNCHAVSLCAHSTR